MVNFHEASQTVEVEVKNLSGRIETMTITTLNSTQPTAENSFEEPFLVRPSCVATCHALLSNNGLCCQEHVLYCMLEITVMGSAYVRPHWCLLCKLSVNCVSSGEVHQPLTV